MSDLNPSIFNSQQQTAVDQCPSNLAATHSKGSSSSSSDSNYFFILFVLLLSAMTVRQSTVMTESAEIQMNASIQNMLNKENAQITFSILPSSGAKTNTIDRVQEKDEQYAAIRENIQNSLVTARQVGEVEMTQTSTNINILQQDASENSGWLQTLNTIFQVIDSMTQSG